MNFVHIFVCLIFFNVYLVLRERQTDRASAEKLQGHSETQNLEQAPGSELSAQSLTWGSNPQTVRS